MDEPYIGEIRLFAGDFAPAGWRLCDGATLQVRENTPLYAVLGNEFGGKAPATFALPDLRDRVPMQAGQGPELSNRPFASAGGQAGVSLTEAQVPAHDHAPMGLETPGNQDSPAGGVWARSAPGSAPYHGGKPAYDAPFNKDALASTGGGSPHNNRQPYLGLSYCIAVVGIFPAP
ncbi:MAG: phage tail protein [Acidimicrobiales bacterium]